MEGKGEEIRSRQYKFTNQGPWNPFSISKLIEIKVGIKQLRP
jgi:hypothetical protein